MFPTGRLLVISVLLAALAASAQTTPAADDRHRAADLMAAGLKLFGRGTPETLQAAALDYQEAADLWRKLGDDPKRLEALVSLATVHFNLHETGEASAVLNQALDLARATGNRVGEGTVLASLALLHHNLGDQRQAIDELAQVRRICQELGDKNAELQATGSQGFWLEAAKDYPAAIEAYERGLALSRETSNRKAEALMLLRLAQVHEILPQQDTPEKGRQEAWEKAAELFVQVVPLLQANADRLNEANAWWGLGTVNERLGRIDQARDAYLKALPLLPDLKNSEAEGQILLSLASDENKLQQVENAIKHYEQALPLLASANDASDQYKGEIGLGTAREALGQNAKALEAYQAAVTVAHATGDKSAEGTTHLRIGLLQFNAHALNEAFTAYGEAGKLFEAIGDRQSQALALAGMASVYRRLGEYKKQLECSQRELALLQNGNDRFKANALMAVADGYIALHESRKALEYLDQARTLNEQNPAAKAWVLMELGEVYYGMGDQKKALQVQNEALDIERSLRNPAAEAKVQNDLGLTYSAMGERTKARNAFQDVLKDAKARTDIQQQSAALSNLARLHQDFGDDKEAKQYYDESLALARQDGNGEQEAATLTGLGMLYHSLGEEQKAIDTLNEALAKRRSIGDRHGEAVTLNSFAIVYSDTGETQKALEAANSAQSIFRELGDTPEIAHGQQTLGSIYQSLGLYERAKSCFEQALETRKQLGDEGGEAVTLNSLGVLAQYQRGPNEALTQAEGREALAPFEESLLRAEKLGNRIAQARLLTNMALVLTDAAELPEAREKLDRSLQIARETGDVDSEALALHNLGFVYSRLGNPDQALAYYRQALDLWRQIRDEIAAARVLSLMAKTEREQGKLKLALDHVNEAIRLNESLRSKLASQEWRASYLATAGNPYETKIGLLMQLHREQPGRGYDAQALETSERARARSLLELLAESRTAIRQGVDPEVLEQERSIERSLNAKASELRKLDPSSEDGRTLEREIEDLTAKHESTEAQIRLKSPAYAALTQPRPLTLGTIQQEVLDADTLLLEYSLGEDRSYLWAVTPTSLWSYELPKRSQIKADASDYFYLLAQNSLNRADLDEKEASLSDALLGRVAAELKGKRLVIVSDGELAAVPFAALPTPSGSRPLIADHEIVIEPSASAVAILRHETMDRKIPPKDIAVIADPVFGESLPSLKHTRDEANGILGLTTPERSMALMDLKASKAAVQDPDLANYRVVHFATHSFLDSVHPGLSYLALSFYDENRQPVDGFLRLNEIFNLRLPVQLVVLSACQTGQGKLVKGEGLVGLTRGFMYAGAASLTVSLWEVDDDATAQLMIRFYKGLLGSDHLHPAAALRAAQLSVMKEDRWGHPYYWAPFIVEGDWR